MAAIKLEPKTYATLSAIDSFRSYWQENERLILQEANRLEIINAPKWDPQTEEERGEFDSMKELASYFHNKEMLPTFRYSSVVMLYAIVERELNRLIKNLEKENGPQKLQIKDIRGEDFIERIQKYSGVFFGLRLSECSNYESLHDLRKIRNCIVHCHGEVKTAKQDAAFWRKLRKSRKGIFAREGLKIYLFEPCIEQFIKEVQEFFEGVFHRLKWEIDDCWKQRHKT
jgi:hypothetical protein